MQPFALLLCVLLRPAVIASSTIVESSQQFLDRYKHLRVPDDHVILIVDAKDLYPSVEHSHLCAVVRQVVAATRYSQAAQDRGLALMALPHMAAGFLSALLQVQHVTFDGLLWRIERGIATGLSCAVHLANIYLTVLDELVKESFNVLWYARFVDDVCVCLPEVEANSLVAFMNSWHPSIVWEVTASGRSSVPFLDLPLSVIDSILVFETHRKPMNAYLYLPRTSTHHHHTFAGLIHGETNRLVKTNCSQSSLVRHVDIFWHALLKRGYSKLEVGMHIRRALHMAKIRQHRQSQTQQQRMRTHYLGLVYSSSTNTRALRVSIRKHKHVLCNFASVGLSFRVQKSLFRQLYSQNWPKTWPLTNRFSGG